MSNDNYAIRHLINHLVLACEWDSLQLLLDKQDWYYMQQLYDPTMANYAQGLMYAADEIQTQENIGIPRAIGWNLLYSSLRSQAANLPIDALQMMVILGQSDSAMRFAELDNDPWRRCKKFSRLALAMSDKQMANQAYLAFDKALDAFKGSYPATGFAELLVDFIEVVLQLNKQEVLPTLVSKALNIEENYRFLPIATIALASAKMGNVERTKQLVSECTKLSFNANYEGFSEDATDALICLAKIAIITSDIQLLMHVVKRAQTIKKTSRCIHALAEFIKAADQMGYRALANNILQWAMESARNISEQETKAEAIAELAGSASYLENVDYILPAIDEVEKTVGEEAKIRLYIFIVQALDQIGLKENAQNYLKLALLFAKGTGPETYCGSHASNLAIVALSALDFGERKIAGLALQEALRAVESNNHDIGYWQVNKKFMRLSQAATKLTDSKSLSKFQFLVLQEKPFLENRTEALANIGLAAAKIGNERFASETLTHILREIKPIDDNYHYYDFAYTMASIALAAAQFCDSFEAKQIITSCYNKLDVDWKDPRDPNGYLSRTLIKISTAAAIIDEKNLAKKTLSEACQSSSKITINKMRAKVLCNIIHEAINIKDQEIIDNGTNMLTHMESGEVDNPGDQAVVSAWLAHSALEVHQIEKALISIDRVLQIPLGEYFTAQFYDVLEALIHLIEVAYNIGRQDIVEKCIQQAVHTYRSTGDPDILAGSLPLVARAAVHANNKIIAQKLFSEALKNAENISNNRERLKAISSIAKLAAESGQNNLAQQAISIMISHKCHMQSVEIDAVSLSSVSLAASILGNLELVQTFTQEAIQAMDWERNELSSRIGDDLAKVMVNCLQTNRSLVLMWLTASFQIVRRRGRMEFLSYIGSFSPIVAKLGFLTQTLAYIQTADHIFGL